MAAGWQPLRRRLKATRPGRHRHAGVFLPALFAAHQSRDPRLAWRLRRRLRKRDPRRHSGRWSIPRLWGCGLLWQILPDITNIGLWHIAIQQETYTTTTSDTTTSTDIDSIVQYTNMGSVDGIKALVLHGAKDLRLVSQWWHDARTIAKYCRKIERPRSQNKGMSRCQSRPQDCVDLTSITTTMAATATLC